MIARNSVILIDQVEEEKAQGRDPWDAVVEATAHRFRPIRSPRPPHPRHDPDRADIFWGPMAYAIMGGLAVATLLTLVFLPALYVAWFRIKQPDPQALAAGSQPVSVDISQRILGGDMSIDPALLSPVSGLVGALIGGSTSLMPPDIRNAAKTIVSALPIRLRTGDGLRRLRAPRVEFAFVRLHT